MADLLLVQELPEAFHVLIVDTGIQIVELKRKAALGGAAPAGNVEGIEPVL